MDENSVKAAGYRGDWVIGGSGNRDIGRLGNQGTVL